MIYCGKTRLSFRYGTLTAKRLVELALKAGLKELVLTNINSTADTWDFVDACRQAAIKPIVGAEIRNGLNVCYVLLAKNEEGLECINRFLTKHLTSGEPFPQRFPIQESVYVIYPLSHLPQGPLLAEERIGIRPYEMNQLHRFKTNKNQLVAWLPITFEQKVGYNMHRLLRVIDQNTLIGKQDNRGQAEPEECFEATVGIGCELLSFLKPQSAALLAACSLSTELFTSKNKAHFLASAQADVARLRALAFQGLNKRYGTHHAEARRRVEHELSIITSLKFTAYFLIAQDIVHFAKSKGFFYVGRGSGANSIVAYCLEITDVDPITLDLYFERFLNPARTSPPDFDMDFSWGDRDQVIAYIFSKYGREHTVLLGMYSTFQRKAAIRELGKVFGLPKNEIEGLLGATFDLKDPLHRQVVRYAERLKDYPNHLSIHAGGVLISEKPIYRYLAAELPPKGFPTAQMDMFLAEKIGLYKLDILSQRGLGHIKDALMLVKKTQGIDVDLRSIDRLVADPKVAQKLKIGDTIGCFYIESPAMRQLLKKLACADYRTLVAASSIIRPGVARSGMMRRFITAHQAPDKVPYLHPIFKELLSETYGIMVYQEDVIKVAHYFGGLTMAEADILRRAMSGKYRSKDGFEQLRSQFFNNCRDKGYSAALIAEVWRQMESFAGYSFSKAHSASYAVESYQSLYLKTYFPVEFMVAVINNFGGFYSTELYLTELKKTGVEVLAPCVNQSHRLTDIVSGRVFLGLGLIQGLERQSIQRLLEERAEGGAFLSLSDFMHRVPLAKEQLNLLIRVGAFQFTGKNKKNLLWEVGLLNTARPIYEGRQTELFLRERLQFELPKLSHRPLDDLYQEMELLGFPVGDVFDLLEMPEGVSVQMAKDLPDYQGKTVAVIGYFVTYKRVRTVNRSLMYFGVFLDRDSAWLDTVHFPQVARQYPFRGAGFYLIRGRVQEEYGTYSITVQTMEQLGLKSRYT